MPRSKQPARKIRFAGEGTYYQQPNNTWQYKISVGQDAEGKTIRKTFYGKSQPEAKAKADAWKSAQGVQRLSVSPDIKKMVV